jgi:hypothetical protein
VDAPGVFESNHDLMILDRLAAMSAYRGGQRSRACGKHGWLLSATALSVRDAGYIAMTTV